MNKIEFYMEEIEYISNLISILTPIILLVWFYYSQKQRLAREYFSELTGLYAGFTKSNLIPLDIGIVNSGIILNIRKVDSKGYFKGEFDYAETELCTPKGQSIYNRLSDGIYSFFGDLNFRLFLDKKRHPFQLNENRIYKGKIYIVSRMDFNIDNYNLNDYLLAEYTLKHYREMQTIKFTLKKNYSKGSQNLPDSFILYKSFGLNFEPYTSLKSLVFIQTRVDK